jgi:hypothetical protein
MLPVEHDVREVPLQVDEVERAVTKDLAASELSPFHA